MKMKHLVRWLSIVGLVVHLAFLLSLGPLSEIAADRVWERMRNDPEYVPGYEMWEADWNRALMVMGIPPCICLPAVLLTIAVNLYLAYKHYETRFWQLLGIGLGISSALYALAWVSGP